MDYNGTRNQREEFAMQIIQDRRALHRIPELELHLPQTCEYVLNALAGLRCRVFQPIPSAVCAWFDFGGQSAIAFRADMDALPITERTGAGYASCHPGRMHACGHDGHTAMLLELARRLDKKEELPHNVLLIFQPGEESPGGAAAICRTGVLREYDVEAVFGAHLWPGLEKGVVFARENEMMSHGCEVNVDIFGRSAHIAKASSGIDAMAAGCEFLRRAAQAEAAYPPHIYRLLKFGKMTSGTARNAISDHTRLEGSLRAFQDEVFDGLLGSLYSIAAQLEGEMGCRVELTLAEGYPAVMNDPAVFRRVNAIAPLAEPGLPSMTTEDFSRYQQEVPGLYVWLGVGDTPPLHADDFDFDEDVLRVGADFFEKIAAEY